MWPSSGAPSDASHEAGPDPLPGRVSGAQHKQEAPAAQDLALSAAERCDRSTKPSLVRRHYLHSYAAGLLISRGDHGLAQPQGFGAASVEQHGWERRVRPSHRFAAQNDCRATDNRMIERLWQSLKYEYVYLNAFETGSEMRSGVGKWLTYYNSERPHSTHVLLTPSEAYASKTEQMKLAT